MLVYPFDAQLPNGYTRYLSCNIKSTRNEFPLRAISFELFMGVYLVELCVIYVEGVAKC